MCRLPYVTGTIVLLFMTLIFVVFSLVAGESDHLYSILEHCMLVLGACLNLFPLWVLWTLSGRIVVVVSDDHMQQTESVSARFKLLQ
jgi:hypothetical protein